MATVTGLGFRIWSSYDGDGMRRAQRDVDLMSRSLSGFSSRTSSMIQGIAALGPAVIPILAAVAAGAAAMAVAVGGATVAFGLFGLSAKNNIGFVMSRWKALQAAREAYSKATTQAGRDAALEAQRKALEGLTRTQRGAIRALDDFKKARDNFGKGSRDVQLIAFQAILRGLANALKVLEPVVKPMSKYFAELAARFEAFSKGSGMQGFSTWLATSGVAAFRSITESVIRFGKGIAGMFKTMSQMTGGGKSFTDWLTRVSTSFQKWGEDGKGVTNFFEFVRKASPPVVAFFSALWNAIKQVTIALGPLGGIVLVSLAPMLNIIAKIAEKCPWLVQGIWAIMMATKALSIAFIALRLAAVAFLFVMNMNPLMIVVTVIAAIVLAVILLYKNCDTARKIINTAVNAIGAAWQWLYNTVIFPIIGYIVNKFQTVLAPAFMALWKGVIVPVFNGIRAVAGAVLNWLGGRLSALGTFLTQVVGPAIAWFYTNFVRPVFNAIGAVVGAMWSFVRPKLAAFGEFLSSSVGPRIWAFLVNVIRPVFGAIKWAVGGMWSFVWPKLRAFWVYLVDNLAPRIFWFLNGVIRPIFNGIKAVIGGAWSFIWPKLRAFWVYLVDNLAPRIFWFLNSVIRPVWGAIKAVIGGAWSFIWPKLRAFWVYLVDNLAPRVWWFLNGVIRPVWNAIKAVIGGAWSFIWPKLRAFWVYLVDNLAPRIWWFLGSVIRPVWNAIKNVIGAAWSFIWPKLRAFWVYLVDNLAPRIRWFYNSVIKPIWNAIKNAISAAWSGIWPKLKAFWTYLQDTLGPRIRGFYNNTVKPIWNAIKNAVSSAWSGIWPKLKAFWTYLQDTLGPRIRGFFHNTVKPIWNAVRNAVSNAWSGIWPKLKAFWTYLQDTLGPRIRGFLNNTVRPVWTSVRNVIGHAWSGIKSIFNAMKSGMGSVADAFRAGQRAIATVWNKIRDSAKGPVRFLIDTVWNNGIVKVWNSVVAKIPGIGKVKGVGMPKGLAAGGIVPGYQSSKKDDVMMPMRKGEGVLVPEVVRGLGAGFINNLNSLGNRGVNAVRRGAGGLAAGGVAGEDNDKWFRIAGYDVANGGYAKGGIVGGIGDAVGGFIKGAKKFFTGGLSKAVSAVTSPMLSGLAGISGKSGIPGMGYIAGKHIVDKVTSFIMSKEGDLTGGGGASVVAAARSFLGKGDKGGDNMNNQFNQDWGFGNGTPWCANFVSTCIKKARAEKFYPGYPSASVEGYYGAMKKVPWGKAQPGDLRTTGTGQHINIVEGAPNPRRGIPTIGGNQGPVVNRRIDNSGYILRPKPGAPRSGGKGSLKGVVSGRTTSTTYGGPADSMDNSRQASGIPHNSGSLSSPYWPIGTKVTLKHKGKTNQGTIEEFGPAAWAIAQHNPKAIIDVGYLMARRMGLSGSAVTDFAVNSWGRGPHYIGGKPGGPGWKLAGGGKIPGYKDGGAMAPGELAIVGEAGAELFRAGSGGGTVFPNGEAPGGSGQVTLTIEGDVYVKNEREFRQMVVSALAEAKRKGQIK